MNSLRSWRPGTGRSGWWAATRDRLPEGNCPGRPGDREQTIRAVAGSTVVHLLISILGHTGVTVVVYTGDVFEEKSPARGRKLADAMGLRSMRLIVLHDTADWNAKRDAEMFLDLARRTGGCVLPFDANAPGRLRDLLAAVAVYAVGGTDMLVQKSAEMPAAALLLEHLRR